MPVFLLPILARLSPLGPMIKAIGRTLGAPVSFKLPVWLVIVIPLVAWWQWDSYAAARVKAAVAELVAGEELAAANAKASGLQKIIDAQRRQAEQAEAARKQFEADLAAAERNAEELSNELADTKANTVNPDGVVDRPLAGRLHNR